MDWEHPKKRRRRIEPRKPLSARLVFDESLSGDAATLSPDLWTELGFGLSPALGEQNAEFSGIFSVDDWAADGTSLDALSIHVALTPVTPFGCSVDETPWTIVPVGKNVSMVGGEKEPLRSTVFLSPESHSSQSFLRIFEVVDRGRHSHHVPKQIDIRMTEVEPIGLETVYVTVERGLLQKVDEIQSRFGGGFHSTRPTKQEYRPAWQNFRHDQNPVDEKTRLTTLVRDGLSRLAVVHSGDVFQLPLPAHPITHVRPPPAIAMHCEPVLQGKISPSTKIVLVQAGSSQEKAIKQLQPPQPIIEESIEDTTDTSTDQFFSAAEDRQNETASEVDGVTSEDASNSEESADESDDASDDSMDDIITLSAPTLPPAQSGTLSAMTSATPRPGDRRGSGLHTPGSVYSNFTSATARAGSRPGKVFRTESLIRKTPREALHPRPSVEDDEEAFVFVDTSTLAKIGCFSGDWVRIEAAKNISAQGFPTLNLSGPDFNQDEDEWRSVRIYGLSGIPNQRPRYAVDKSGGRRSSFSGMQGLSLTPTIYLSPVLLANMKHVTFVKVGILPRPTKPSLYRDMPMPPKSATYMSPPLATDVTLRMISSPLTKRKELQPILISRLKHHFETRKRILKRGDVLPIVIDSEVGKATFSPPNQVDDELLVRLENSDSWVPQSLDIAWFWVEHISTGPVQDLDDIERRDSWGGVATVDTLKTRMNQSGNRLQSIAESVLRQTQYWLGVKQIPKLLKFPGSTIVAASDIPALASLPLESRLRDLIAATVSPRAINLGMPPTVILLHSNQRQIGKSHAAISACAAAGVRTFVICGHDLLSENASTSGGGDVKTELTLKTRAERAMSSGAEYTALLIQHIEVLTADRMIPTFQEIISSSRVLIATTTELDKIPPGLRSLFTHEIQVTAPDEATRELILRNLCLSLPNPVSSNVSTKSIALQTAALVAGDLVDLVNRAALARSRRLLDLAQSQTVSTTDLSLAGGLNITHVLPDDFNTAISTARSTFSDAIGAPKIPTVTWDDVGGLATQKDAIMETISLPLTRPELFASGIRKRSGILFYGPPGTGKTLLAKAIATEFSLNFFSVKGPELLNMYIGESEANVRRVFQRARDARPCVVFFDELDSVAPKRGNQGDSGGVMDRIVSQLLAELDGMSKETSGGVFVIGATNRPDLLDPALLRPGRFDKMLYLGVASDHPQQVTILRALTRKFHLASDVDLKRVAERLPLTYTGADLYALCSDAMLKAITRKTKMVDRKVEDISRSKGEQVSTAWFFDHMAGPEDTAVVVNDADFIVAQAELVGSVSAKELEHFERIRRLFESQDIGVDNRKVKGKEKDTTGIANHLNTTQQMTSVPLPVRPVPEESVTTLKSAVSKDKGKGRAESFGNSNSFKGRGKQKSSFDHHPYHHHHHHRRIANPDSGPESDADESSDVGSFGIGHRHSSSTTIIHSPSSLPPPPSPSAHATNMNGSIYSNNATDISAKAKGKQRAVDDGGGGGGGDGDDDDEDGLKMDVERSMDGFLNDADVEGDDEGLYS